MDTGTKIRIARERAGLTQTELAKRVGVSMRSVGNWERGDTSPQNKMAALRDALYPHWPGEDSLPVPSIKSATDAELIAELAYRLGRAQASGRSDYSEGATPPGGQATS